MHPVLGTMMPEICEAPHLSDFPLYSSLCSGFNVGGCVHLILLIRINFIVQCVERRPYHVVIQFNNWLNYFPDCPDKN
ncbi:hypothetical protein CEJ50_18230 [Escherichia coli]|nr:hypothetical protein CEJ50_18230 [Escherichia coli]